MKCPEGGEIRCCVGCRKHFTLTREELEWYAERGFQYKPASCPKCRAARRLRSRLWHQNEARREAQNEARREALRTSTQAEPITSKGRNDGDDPQQ